MVNFGVLGYQHYYFPPSTISNNARAFNHVPLSTIGVGEQMTWREWGVVSGALP
jgi:hypothetical protein